MVSCGVCGASYDAAVPVDERVREHRDGTQSFVVIDATGWLVHRCDITGLSRLEVAELQLDTAERIEDVLARVRIAARELVAADGATIVLRDGDECFYVDEDAIEPLWKGQRFPLDACISGWVMANEQHAAIADIVVDDRIPQDAYEPTFVKSLVMVPVATGGAPVAAIGTYWATAHGAPESEIESLTTLAAATARALERVAP